MKKTIEETIAFIQKAHDGQTDYAGKPYWQHPVAVMQRLPESASDETRLIALLHDVLEDTDRTEDDLRTEGYSEWVITGVKLLTRTPDKGSYMDGIRAIVASGHLGAMQVKLADNEENSDPSRIASIADSAKREQMTQMAENRYRRSMVKLRNGLKERGYDV